MPLNLQERHQSLSIPPGWSVPEFSLGQIVSWTIPNSSLQACEAWGEVIGLTWWGSRWNYDVILNRTCPIALAYPGTWGTEESIEILSADQMTLKLN